MDCEARNVLVVPSRRGRARTAARDQEHGADHPQTAARKGSLKQQQKLKRRERKGMARKEQGQQEARKHTRMMMTRQIKEQEQEQKQ